MSIVRQIFEVAPEVALRPSWRLKISHARYIPFPGRGREYRPGVREQSKDQAELATIAQMVALKESDASTITQRVTECEISS